MDLEQCRNRLKLCRIVRDVIIESKSITDLELKSLLEAKGILVDDEDFFGVISDLLTCEGSIQRDDYWSCGAVYSYIDSSSLRDSPYSKHHYSFTVDDNVFDKHSLHISDLHIGNSELEDFRLLDSVYDFAIGNGANKCFLTGDILQGKTNGNLSKEEMLAQLNSFISSYPNPSFYEMATYASIGNHDETIHGYFQLRRNLVQEAIYDLRGLNTYLPSFYVIPRESFRIDFSNVPMHFSHRLYISWLRPNVRIVGLDELDCERRWLNDYYDVLWSGHLHRGFIYTTDVPLVSGKQIIYLGVPSTSKYNLGRVVAYISHLHYNQGVVRSMDVDLLRCDSNYHIIKEEEIHWDFSRNNKTYQKIL